MVTITGKRFTASSTVEFGTVPATAVTFVSATKLNATSPAESAGKVDVRVISGAHTSPIAAKDRFTYTPPPAPVVTSINPPSGPTAGGTTVTVTGTALASATAVKFGTTAGTVTADSATSITVTSPAESAGTVDVTVTTAGGTSATSAADQFTYGTPLPVVTSISPPSGPTAGGTTVTVTGTALASATAVKFGTTAGTVTADSATSITVTSPAESAGTVDVTVTTAGGTSATSAADQFTYGTPLPVVTSISPPSGPTAGGTTVTVTGTALASATAVKFGTTAGTVTADSATSITVTSPAESAGTVDVTVTTAGGTSATSAADQFTYGTPVTPVVTSISPTSGPTAGGTTVTVTGTALASATAVKFGTTAGTVTADSATSITVTSPAESAGTVDVTVTTPGGTSAPSTADHFTFVLKPVVTSISPNSGLNTGGDTVTINGSSLTTTTSVTFGTTTAPSFTIQSDSAIIATSPPGSGTAHVTVTTAGGTSATSTADEFTYGATEPAPTVTSISPTTGPTSGGTAVTITGDGFTGATGVKFGTTASPSFTIQSNSVLTAVSPSGAAGAVDVTVTTSGGTSATSAADRFTFVSLTGCTIVWVGTDGSSWSDALDWNQNRVPTSSDNVCIPAGIQNLPVQLGSSATITSLRNDGGLQIGASLTISGTSSTSTGSLSITGTLGVSGTLSVTGALTTSGGNITGPGTVTVASGATWLIPNNGGVTVSGGKLVNQGTATIDPSGVLSIAPGAVVTNAASFTMDFGSTIEGTYQATCSSTAQFSNTGTLVSSPGLQGTAYLGSSSYCLTMANTSGIQMPSGTLDVNYSGTLQLNSGSSITGVGTLADSGSLMVNVAQTMGALMVSGTVSGFGNLTVSGTLTTTGGSFSGPGAVTIASGATWLIPNSVTVSGGQVVNDGTATVDPSAILSIAPGAVVTNAASFTMDFGSTIEGTYQATCTTTVQFSNTGTLVSSPGPLGTAYLGSSPYYCLTTANAGIIQLSSGTLDVNYNGTLQLNSGSSITGPGSLADSGSLMVNVDQTMGALMVSGTVSGFGTLTVSGTLTTTGGSFSGPGTVTIASGATWLIPNSVTVSGGQVVNDGTATVDPSAILSIAPGAVVTNAASFTMDFGSTIEGTYQATCTTTVQFSNTGTLVSSPGPLGTAYLGSSPYYCLTTANAGIIQLSSGTLDVNYNGTLQLNSGSSIAGPGTLADSGSLVVNVDQTIGSMAVSGTVSGSGTLTVSGTLTTTGGNLSGPGTVTVASGGAWLIPNGATVSGGQVVNDGTATIYPSGVLSIAPGAVVTNAASFTMEFGSTIEGTYQDTCPSTVQFSNTGTLVSSPGPQGTVYLGSGSYCLTATNTGTMQLASGTLQINGGSVLTLNGGSAIGGAGTFADNGDVVANVGQSVSNLTMQGGKLELAIGVVLGVTSLPSSSGTIQLDAAGPGQFGSLSVSGAASVANLNLVLNTSYTPVCGTSVTAIRAGSTSGQLASASGPLLPPSGTWQPITTSTTAGAFVKCPPPPEAAAQLFGNGSSIDAYNTAGYFAEPVNTATGAFSTTETDAKLGGLGIPFVFTRSYTSSNSATGPLGVGWTDSMNVTAQSSGGNVTISDENGQQVMYIQQSGGSYSGPPGVRSVLTSVTGGGWLLVRHNQDRLTFDTAGQLTSEVDRNGIGLNLTYNSSGQLQSVNDFAGRTANFTYNAQNLLQTLVFPGGSSSRTISYSYTSNQLTLVTNAAGGVTKYTYNSQGLLATVIDQNGNQVVANTYDSSGRITGQVNALNKSATFSYNTGTQTCTYTDPDGQQWQDLYQGNVLVERINPLKGTTTYAYDSNLDVTALTDPDGNTTTMSYDSNGNRLSRTSALPATETWTYDSMNDVATYTDPLGHVTKYTYDSSGNLLVKSLQDGATTSYTRYPTGAIKTMTNPNGNLTSYVYDSSGNLTSQTSPLVEKITYTYDAAGRRATMVDARGNASGGNPTAHTTTYVYNALDELISTTNANGDVTMFGYDSVGNRTSVTDPDNHTTSYGYDKANELTTVTAPGPATTSYGYDNNGNRTSILDADGNTTNMSYDAANRLASVSTALGTNRYTYDGDGNRTSITDAVGATTTETYDAVNRLKTITYSDGTPGVTYTYDADGNRLQMVDGSGTTSYTYDTGNRLGTVTHGLAEYSYTYDADNDVTSRTYPDGTLINSVFDKDDRLQSLTEGSAAVSFGYDPNGDLTSTTLPAGNGYIESVTYDASGRPTLVSATKGTATLTSYGYSYDAAGNPTTIVANGQTQTLSYDTRNRLATVCYGTSCSGGSITWTYDGTGNRKTEVLVSGTTVKSSGTVTYTYTANRMMSTVGPGGTTTYGYDSDGRRTSMGSTTYQWNAANELTSLSAPSGVTTYSYDGLGDRLSGTSGGATTNFSYDVNNPVPILTLETDGAGNLLDRYLWGNGLLQAVHTNGSDYYVSHDAQGSVVGLTSATGATEATYSYDPYGNVLTTNKVDPSSPNLPVGFESQLTDPTGLIHLMARQYDPTVGAFLSVDPLPQNPTDSALSPYVYSGDQPTVLNDPTGACVESGQGYYEFTVRGSNGVVQQYHWSSFGAWETAIEDGYDVATSAENTPEGFVYAGDIAEGADAIYTLYKINNQATQAQQAANQYLNAPITGVSPDSEQYYNDQISNYTTYESEENPLSILQSIL